MSQDVDWERYVGAAVDLDGVLTRTAAVHQRSWKGMFDEFLEQRRARGEPGFEPFDGDRDYPQLVDGLPRLDGVRAFLRSRGVELPEGDAEDGLEDETVAGLGARKNALFRSALSRESVEVWDDAVRFLRARRSAGWRVCVVSSSRNCELVVEAAGLSELFDDRVDGVVIGELGMRGKPDPDMFAEAARRLDADTDELAAFEDASPGVRSASRAGYGLVVGVDREGVAETLREDGAHVVVASFDELSTSG